MNQPQNTQANQPTNTGDAMNAGTSTVPDAASSEPTPSDAPDSSMATSPMGDSSSMTTPAAAQPDTGKKSAMTVWLILALLIGIVIIAVVYLLL